MFIIFFLDLELFNFSFFFILLKAHTFSGEKISPIEVDAVLLAHPDIAQAVAFGVPDPKYGEEVLYLPNLILYIYLS
jgi:AMP-binding enzyme C-terminal domain